jgi:O-antigen/teichoic acid export membrane protein
MQQDLINSGGQDDSRMDVYGRSVKGGAWLIALRAFVIVLSFVRLPIVLRLLAPYDFGLLHIGALLTGMAGSFTNFGLQTALIQRKDNTPGHLNIVWTINIIRGLVIFCFLYLVAPYAVIFFDGSGRFEEGHIVRPEALVERLQSDDDLLSEYLVSGFSEPTRRMLDEYDDSAGVSASLEASLVDELNEVVEGAAIYDKDRFAGVELSKYSQNLAVAAEGSRDDVRFNRRLLEESFEGIIKRDILDRQMATLVIQVLAMSVVLAAFRNIGTMYFTKELEFKKHAMLQAGTEAVSFVVTVSLAFVYRNVWALVFGRVSGVVCSIILSYIMHPYRPRVSFDLSKAKELWGFGKHLFGIGILKFFCLNGDDIFLGRMLGTTVLGFYQQAFRIGNMVATEVGNKVSTIAFPAYSKLQDNVAKLRNGYFKSLRLTTMVVFPAAGGLIVLAPEITEVVFGVNWLPMVPAMQILCLLGPLRCMQRGPVFMAMGRPDIITKMSALRLVLMVATIYPLTIKWGMAGTSLCVLGVGIVLQPIGIYELQKLIGAKMRDILKILSYPATATLVMMLCIYFAKNAISSVGAVLLGALVGLGVVVYLAVIFLLSKLSPDYDALESVRDITRGLKS